MQAIFIHHKDPFRPNLNREVEEFKPGLRIKHFLKSKGFVRNGKRTSAFIVMVNGKAVMRRQWYRRIQPGEVVSVCALPRGGGGGSNPLQIVAMIAIAIAAAYTGGAAAAAYGPAYGAAVGAAVSIAGAMLVNLMFPPDTMKTAGETSREAASPTYSLSAQGNSARLLEAIPVMYGRNRMYPDFAASPYTEIAGNDEYLYQLFCISQGSVEIEKIQIGDTDISNYEGVTYQVVNPGERLTLFPANVVTSPDVSNLQMFGPNEADFEVLGPFVLNAAGTQCNAIGVDWSLPNGLFTMDDKGDRQAATVAWAFEYQLIDNSGVPQGPWMMVESNSLVTASVDPIRLSAKLSVPLGRYQIRATRTNNKATDGRTADVLYWNTARGYLEEPNNYGDLTLLAVVMKATNQLSQTNNRKVNIIGTRKLPTWNPVEGWSLTPVATRNPAWAFADIIRNANYGRNLPTSRMNIQELYRLAGVWAARGDTFNFVFDTTTQLWDALTKVAKVGRAVPIYQAGVIDIVRNEPQTLPVAMFHPQNMVKGSFIITYNFADVDTADCVIVEYVDETTWQTDEVECVLPGGTNNNPARIQLIGCTNRDQAWREGITIAAQNKYQRRVGTFTTDESGLIPLYGDLTQISHDVPQWGYSGRVHAFDRATGDVTASEPFVWSGGSSGYVIAFRKRNGAADGPYSIVATADPYVGRLVGTTQAQRDAIFISDGVRTDYTQYQFGPTNRAGLLAVLQSASPSEDGAVAMSVVNYAPEVYAAETGGIIPNPNQPSDLPKPPQAPVIDKVSLEYTFVVGQQTIVATPANGAQYYEFRFSADYGATWVRLGTDASPQMRVALAPGNYLISVRAVGVIAGAWNTVSVTVDATTLPLVEIDAFTASTDQVYQIQLAWAIKAGNAGIADRIEVRHNLSNDLGSSVVLGTFAATTTTYTHANMGPGETHFYWIRVIDKAGRNGPFFNSGTPIIGQSSSDAGKILDYLNEQITESQLSAALLEKIESDDGAIVEINIIKSQLAAMYTIKTQLTVDGRTYMAGIGVGVENNAGIIESQVLIAASRFAVLDPNTAGSVRSPFIVAGGVVYMDTAFIQNASITNAKIGGTIQSNAVNSQGNPLWSFDKNGVASFYGTGAGNARLEIVNNEIRLYDSSANLAIQISTNL